MLILISGGTRSGKSAYAEERLAGLTGSEKVYVATARVHDEEMRSRVRVHRARREGLGFVTIERECDLQGLELRGGSCVLIEGLTTWTANEMFRESGETRESDFVVERVMRALEEIASRAEHVIVVGDDIFCDGTRYDELTERYIHALGELHVRIAEIADEVIEFFAGMPVCYKLP